MLNPHELSPEARQLLADVFGPKPPFKPPRWQMLLWVGAGGVLVGYCLERFIQQVLQ